jgi:hypothetical protein
LENLSGFQSLAGTTNEKRAGSVEPTRPVTCACRQSQWTVTVNEPASSQDAPPSAIEAVTVMTEDPGFVQPKTLDSPVLAAREPALPVAAHVMTTSDRVDSGSSPEASSWIE